MSPHEYSFLYNLPFWAGPSYSKALVLSFHIFFRNHFPMRKSIWLPSLRHLKRILESDMVRQWSFCRDPYSMKCWMEIHPPGPKLIWFSWSQFPIAVPPLPQSQCWVHALPQQCLLVCLCFHNIEIGRRKEKMGGRGGRGRGKRSLQCHAFHLDTCHILCLLSFPTLTWGEGGEMCEMDSSMHFLSIFSNITNLQISSLCLWRNQVNFGPGWPKEAGVFYALSLVWVIAPKEILKQLTPAFDVLPQTPYARSKLRKVLFISL
jgi:hypothetical protein